MNDETDPLAPILRGGKAALARALTELETAPRSSAVVARLDAAHARPIGHVLGLTGPPGVGKSTLTNALIRAFRERGERVAVIAVDPSSRHSRGALLGDRTRIETDPEDTGLFMRSMAARERLGGLAELTWPASVLLRAVFDWVIVETVGVGQSEAEIADCADLVVFCAQPASGDSLQFMKAGLMEDPDLILVTKADLGASARRTAGDLKGALSLTREGRAAVEVVLVSAQTGEGVGAAIDAMAASVAAIAADGTLARRRTEQRRAWRHKALLDLFGSIGLGLAGVSAAGDDAPFAGFADEVGRLERRYRQAVLASD